MNGKTRFAEYNVTRHIVSESAQMQAVFEYVHRVASTKATVLITGETGVGKEVIAQAIHDNSPRRKGPFKEINCGAFSKELIQSELFGHKKGAFTTAIRQHRGIFEQANGGTLFLDEVGEMPFEAQVKLLRVLEDQEFTPVGGEQVIKVDVRLIAATNINLKTAVNEKRFREDLYYRLNLFRIQIPPLRNRRSDIPPLVQNFVSQLSEEHNKSVTRVTPEALTYLQNADWPGNVRELRNVIEAAIILTEDEELGEEVVKLVVENLDAPEETSDMIPTVSDHSNAVVAGYSQTSDETSSTLVENIKDGLWTLIWKGTLPEITAHISLMRYVSEVQQRTKKDIAKHLKISVPTLDKYCGYAKKMLKME